MKTSEKLGQVTVEHNVTKKQNYQGAKYFRDLVEWMNARDEYLNDNKSTLHLMREFNKVWN